VIRKETDNDYSAIADTNSALTNYDNTADGKTILSREYILRTCESEGKLAMLPIVIVMLVLCVLSPIFITPASGTFERCAILLIWILGITIVVIQFSKTRKLQKSIREALPLGNFTICLTRTQRRRRYSCYVEIDGKDRKVPVGAFGQMRMLGEEDVYILMINNKIVALYPAKQFALDADLFRKMSVAHPLQGFPQ
jgi:hypothetical protein